MKDAYYFPHDSNAKDDPKVVMLIEQLGLEGYGIYWVLIETLRDQPSYRYPLKLLPALARRYLTSSEKVETVVNNYDLFAIDAGEFFLSPSLTRRMSAIDEKRRKLSEAGRRGRAKQLQQVTGHPQATPKPSPGHPWASKGKERKEKKRKKNNNNTFNPSSLKPESVSDDSWNDFLANRKHKKLQNTERALNTILKSFEEGLDRYSYEQMIDVYVSTNMQRFDPAWMDSSSTKSNVDQATPLMQGVI